MRSRLAAVALAAALLGSSAPAWADHAEAVKLFDEGRKLRDEGKFDKAARSFEQSIKVEPSIGAYYNLGLVNEQLGKEQLGKLREAADRYRESRNLAHQRNDAREKDAVDALAKLLETNSYVRLEIDDKTAAAPGLRVTVDGETVPPSQFNGEIFRRHEPREAVITAVGRKEVKLPLRNKQAFTVVLGEPTSDSGPPPLLPRGETGATGGGWGWLTFAGVGVAGAGLLTLGVGIYLNVKHENEVTAIRDSQPANCADDPSKPTPCIGADKAKVDQNNAVIMDKNKSAETTLPIVYGAGAVLLVGGVLLIVFAPGAPPSSASAPPTARVRVIPQISPRDSGLYVVGTF